MKVIIYRNSDRDKCKREILISDSTGWPRFAEYEKRVRQQAKHYLPLVRCFNRRHHRVFNNYSDVFNKSFKRFGLC